MLTFRFKNSNGETKDIEIQLSEISREMEDFAFEKLSESVCDCSESNAKDCDCYEKVNGFNLSLVGEYLPKTK